MRDQAGLRSLGISGHNLTAWCSMLYPNTLLHFTAGYLRKRLIATALRCARFRGRAALPALFRLGMSNGIVNFTPTCSYDLH